MANPPSERLCTSCGLCCDGTIYDVAQVKPAETAGIKRHGVELIEVHGKQAIPQPCPLLQGSVCTIYQDRPGSCRAFVCGVLRRVQRQELSTDEALDLVATAKRLASTVRELSPAGQSLAELRRKWLAEQSPGTPPIGGIAVDAPRLHLAMLSLNLFLDQHFRKPHQRVTTTRTARVPDRGS